MLPRSALRRMALSVIPAMWAAALSGIQSCPGKSMCSASAGIASQPFMPGECLTEGAVDQGFDDGPPAREGAIVSEEDVAGEVQPQAEAPGSSDPERSFGRGWKIATAILGVCVLGMGIALGMLYTRMLDSERIMRAQAVDLRSQATRVESVSEEVQQIQPQPGPRGPKGDPGPAGPPGPRGPSGQDGGFESLIGCAMPRAESISVPDQYNNWWNDYRVVVCR